MLNIKLVQTCSACPEQYDAFVDGVQVGYLRLRHGEFTVTAPDVDGQLIYTSENPIGDGQFESAERLTFLNEAKTAITAWLQSRPTQPIRVKSRKSVPKRMLILEGLDHEPLVVTKVTEVNMPKKNFFVEEMVDGTFRLTYSKSLIPDITKFQGLRLIRED